MFKWIVVFLVTWHRIYITLKKKARDLWHGAEPVTCFMQNVGDSGDQLCLSAGDLQNSESIWTESKLNSKLSKLSNLDLDGFRMFSG